MYLAKKVKWYYPNKYQQRALRNCDADKTIVSEKLALFKKAFDKFTKGDLKTLLDSTSNMFAYELKQAQDKVTQYENAK